MQTTSATTVPGTLYQVLRYQQLPTTRIHCTPYSSKQYSSTGVLRFEYCRSTRSTKHDKYNLWGMGDLVEHTSVNAPTNDYRNDEAPGCILKSQERQALAVSDEVVAASEVEVKMR